MNNKRKSFTDTVKVEQEQLNINGEIIKKLNEMEKAYNPNEQNLSRKTNELRSGENVFLNTYLMAGILEKLVEKTKGIVDAHISGRVKSIESSKKKENRPGRKDKENGDIMGFNIVVDRVHNSKDFINVFQDNKIQGLYNERKLNLCIMNMVIKFIKSSKMYNISSELDESLPEKQTTELSAQRLADMKKTCDTILANIKQYDKEDKVLTNDFPIAEYMQVMCKDLLKKEIERAKNELYTQKSNFEEQLKANDMTERERIVLEFNLEKIQERIQLFESRNDWETSDIIKLLYGVVNKKNVQLYTEIIEHIKNKELDNEEGKSKNGESNEKTYNELLILILYQLTKLEFKTEKDYNGVVYNNIWMNLHTQLEDYKNSEIDKKSYRNITFESLQKLTTNLTRLNARLSDPLQYEITKYEMKYFINPIIKAFKGIELPER